MSASSRLGRDTGQYKIIQRLASELSRAIEDDLYSISERLLSEDVITAENQREFIDLHTPRRVRASNLIATVLNRIKSDSRNYTKFIKVLKGDKNYYDAILQKIEAYQDVVFVDQQMTVPAPAFRSYVGVEHSRSTASRSRSRITWRYDRTLVLTYFWFFILLCINLVVVAYYGIFAIKLLLLLFVASVFGTPFCLRLL